MKYIITEQQKERLEKAILEFFDDHLTPYEGWDSHEEYESELEINGGELFLFTEDSDTGDTDTTKHMWYSICDNDNLSEPIPEGECPVVSIPTPTYQALNGYFGDNWKKLFKRWFMSHTGLLVVEIDTM